MRAVLLLASCAAALRLPAGAGASLIPAEVGTVCKATCSVPPGSLYGYVSAGSPVNINVPGDDAGCSTDIAQAVCQGERASEPPRANTTRARACLQYEILGSVRCTRNG